MAAGAAGAGALALTRGALSAPRASANTLLSQPGNHHLAWVWQFDDDGSPEQIRAQLAFVGAGILLKTHDATTWMAKWDKSGAGVDGGAKVRQLRDFFEYGGVPFHAWAVVKGLDPILEAQMAAEVLASGARSLVLDLEPSDGGSFWEGSPESALAYGAELRRLQPAAFVSFAPDPRPWQVAAVPAGEFATFCNEIAPQAYWPMFNNSATFQLLREWGYDIEPGGMTPEYVLDMSARSLGGLGLPIKPVASGSQGADGVGRFLTHAQAIGMPAVSVWRYGTSDPGVWDVLNNTHPVPNDYYGPDWKEPPVAKSADQPKGLAALQNTAQNDGSNTPVVKPKEATSTQQGVANLDRLAKPSSSGTSSQQGQLQQLRKKSFWADPSGMFGSR